MTTSHWMGPAAATLANIIRAPTFIISTSAVRILGARLNTTHNLHYYLSLMRSLRESIRAGDLSTFVESFYADRGMPAPLVAAG